MTVHRGAVVMGSLFVILGIGLLGDQAGWWRFDPTIVIPVTLIALGLSLLLGDRTDRT